MMRINDNKKTKGEQMIPELRELFGVYDNPAQLAGITASKIAKIAENYAFFNRLLELDATSGEKIFSPTRNGVYQELIDIPDTPINGFYTTKEINSSHDAFHVNYLSNVLGSKLINIDEKNIDKQFSKKNLFKVDHLKYQKFFNNYICHIKSEQKANYKK